jgi:Flp pilus assembly protein TadG
MSTAMASFSSPRRKQRGVVLALFAVAMLAMLAMAGLALDSGHSFVNKTRLQNTVDAAALSAARTLNQTTDAVQAQAEALATFSTNASGAGNAEMDASYASGDLSVTVQFSSTLHPFAPGSVPAQYVRVTATNFRLPAWFIQVLGFSEKNVGASAVAGPSPTVQRACNVAPMMVCGDPAAAPEDYFGYELGQATVLKSSTSDFQVGPGNFQLIRLNGGQGAAQLRQAMAGSFNNCLVADETVPTEPGNTVGPVVQGLNTRFGEYLGPMRGTQSQYPPDVIVQEPSPPLTYDGDTETIFYGSEPVDGSPDPDYYDIEDYQADLASPANYDYLPLENGGTGAYGRRTMAVPVGDCTTTTNGQGDVPVLGFLCYHLLQRAVQQGNNSHVFGQFTETGCPITGRPGPNPGTGPGPFIIQLYKDETQEAS